MKNEDLQENESHKVKMKGKTESINKDFEEEKRK